MNKDFSRTITLLRKEKNLSQKQVAEDLGISQALLSHYEKGIRECNLDFVVKVANYFEVTTDYLLGRTTQRYSEIEDLSEEISEERRTAISQILNKRLIANSISVLYEYIIRIGSRKLSNYITDYLMLAVYKMFRYIYSSNPENPDELFSTNKSVFKGYTSAAMQVLSSRIDAATNIENQAEYINDCSDIKMSAGKIAEEYPNMATSVFNVIQHAENSLRINIR